jgi:hypothetical protein
MCAQVLFIRFDIDEPPGPSPAEVDGDAIRTPQSRWRSAPGRALNGFPRMEHHQQNPDLFAFPQSNNAICFDYHRYFRAILRQDQHSHLN